MKVVNIHEAKTQLSKLIMHALNGEKIIIAKNNEPVVELIPYTNRDKRWGYGSLKGKIKIKESWKKADKEIETMILSRELGSE